MGRSHEIPASQRIGLSARTWMAIVLTAEAFAASAVCAAPVEPPDPPPVESVRYTEDYGYLRNPDAAASERLIVAVDHAVRLVLRTSGAAWC